MEIEIKFKENKKLKNKIVGNYEELGVWISNNYSEIEILDIIIMEE